jgi:hypothetical protein
VWATILVLEAILFIPCRRRHRRRKTVLQTAVFSRVPPPSLVPFSGDVHRRHRSLQDEPIVSFEVRYHQLQLSFWFRANPTPRFIATVTLKFVQKSIYRNQRCPLLQSQLKLFQPFSTQNSNSVLFPGSNPNVLKLHLNNSNFDKLDIYVAQFFMHFPNTV